MVTLIVKGKPRTAKTADEVLDWIDDFGGGGADGFDAELLAALCAQPEGSPYDITLKNKASAGELQKLLSRFKAEGAGKASGPSRKERRQAVQEQRREQKATKIAEGKLVEAPVFKLLGTAKTTTPFGAATLRVEAALNPLVGAADSKMQVLDAQREAIAGAIGLLAQASEGVTALDYLQVCRLRQTFEFDTLSGDREATRQAAILRGALDLAETRSLKLLKSNDQQAELCGLAYTCLTPVLGTMSGQAFQALVTGKIMWAPHGVEKALQVASWPQVCAGLGEVLICLPLLTDYCATASGHGALYQWDVEPLLTQMLQTTVRKHKLASLLAILQEIDALEARLLHLLATRRIAAGAEQSLRRHLRDVVVKGASYRSAGQSRQLRMLVLVLERTPQLQCTGYEVTTDDEVPADLCFVDTTTGEEVLAEVESVSAQNREGAAEYVRRRIEHKRQTVAKQLTATQRLVIIVPDAGSLPPDQLQALESIEGVWAIKSD